MRVVRRYVVAPIEKAVRRFSSVGDSVFFDAADFDWVSDLESHWSEIRAELDEVLEHPDRVPRVGEIVEKDQKLSADTDWKAYFLCGYGHTFEENTARCPQTTRLIERVPGIRTAFFSILAPGQQIPEHRGPYCGLLRYHLGLMIPEPRDGCGITVAGETRHWDEGKSLMFDDSFRHHAWNNTDSVRAILFIDVVRPLPFPISILNEGLIWLIGASSYVKDSKKNLARWNKRAYGESS
ncbi:MAG: aspartyl/asparaginyl beta-hydroxylase domain-containing protein [Gammaproteobacteria bacterium]|nr:aspartyl/asparaginyl beta-hydroxylase domain-containing protein [Gammaproteobacteria bacterium]